MVSNKTVVVLGSAYGGARAAQVLAAEIPAGWRIILIDRNSHTNHVYVLPRLSVLPGHEHKAFIPNTKVFMTEDPPAFHRRLQAHVTSISTNSLTLSKAFPEHGIPTETLPFDYAIYALGSHLPAPLNLWGIDPQGNPIPPKTPKGKHLPVYRGFKAEGIAWLQEYQKIIQGSSSILVVGGGALGIQFATDIATVHPHKYVTLVHSRYRLLPRFDKAMHTEILQTLESMVNIDVILGERLDLSSIDEEPGRTNDRGQRIVRTVTGREIATDLILLCTGQTPNTGLLKKLNPATVNPENSLAHVLGTLQLGVLSPPLPTRSILEFPFIATSQGTTKIETKTTIHEIDTTLKQIALADLKAPDMSSDNETHLDNREDQPKPETANEEPLEKTPYPNIFVIGDAADAFGAIPAGHNAYYQGEVAARNVLRLIKRSEGATEADEPLERYQPGLPAIKVSLGLGKSVYQSQGVVGTNNGDPDDLDAAGVWAYFGIIVTNDDQMYE